MYRKRAKRGAPEGDDTVTLMSRIELKRSLESGVQQVYDNGEKKLKTLEDFRTNSVETIHNVPQLAKGVYGDVRQINDEKGKTMAVVKITGCLNTLLGDFALSPFRSEHVEPRILNFLWKHLVEDTRATPHIVAPLGKHAIIPTITESRRYSSDRDYMDNSLVYFMEMASKRDLRRHLASVRYDGNKFELHFRVLLFQVCYTMECIFQRFPDFRHNDLKDDNVYLHTGPVGGYDKYVIHGKTYYIPRIGATALVGDFDFATIPGYMFDNYKTIEQEWHTPTYCINTRRDHGSDMYSLISYLRQELGGDFRLALRNTLNRLYGNRNKRNYNNLRPMPGTTHRPSAKELLGDAELFAQFLVPPPPSGGEVYDTYMGDVHNPIVFPTTWDPTPYNMLKNLSPFVHYQRHCPLIVPRRMISSDDVVDHFLQLPSVIYYRDCCMPADRVIDEEPSVVYDDPTGRDILEKMQDVFDIEPERDNDFTGYGFDEDFKEEFMQNVYEVASDFIRANHVPKRWWCAAFSCAFADTVYDMNMAPECQKCWDMTTWADLWENYGDVTYTNMQMLHFVMQWTWHRNMDL